LPDGQHYAFLALARDLGLLGAEDAAALRDSQTPAREAAVQRRLLSPETAQGVQGALERGHFLCSGCALDLRYGHLGTLPSLSCPTCGGTLTYREASGRQARPHAPRPHPPSRSAPSGLGQANAPRSGHPSGDRHSGLARPSSDRHSGLGRPSSDRHSGLGRPSSDRNSGLGRPSSDRNSGLGRPSSRRSKQEEAKQIGGFLLERELGRGNNGVVYLARRSGLERLFAVKILLHTSKLGQEARKRFRLEAQIGSKLTNPGIVPVYDIGEENDFLYFAMQYVKGEDLAQRLQREKRLAPSIAAGIVRDLAESLAEAHAQQVIHRDLKPANILLPDDGTRPRLTDFGLAKDRELAESMTKSGDILGSPFYMSPEQLQGARVTALADVYALGVILYQCLTGRRPYEAQTPFDLAKKVMVGQCVPPRQYCADIPADLEAICLRAIHVKPDQRTPSAQALHQELSDFLAGKRVQAAPSGSRLNPVAIALGSLAALVLGVGLTLGLATVLGSNEEFERAHVALHAQPPAGPEQLRADLEALETLEPDDERVPRAKTWAAGWRALWKADAAIERGALGEAKGALEEVAASAEAGPFLAEARAEREARIGHFEVLLALRAEVRGRPLSGELLGRWRELRARVSHPALRTRVQSSLLDCLADRQRLKEFQEELREVSDPAQKARERLREGWLHFERGQRAESLRVFKGLAAQSGEIPESTRLAAAAMIHTVEKRREDARPLLRAALREDPEFILVKFWLGMTLAIAGRLTEADRLLAEVDLPLRDNVSYAVWRSRMYLSRQKPQEAFALAQRGISILGNDLSERALIAAFLSALMSKNQQAAGEYSALAKRSFEKSSTLALLEGLYLREKGTDGDALKVWVAAWQRDAKGFEAAAHEILAGSASSILAAIREAAEGPTGVSFFLPLGEVGPQTKRFLERKVRPIPNAQARELVLGALIKLAGGQPYEEGVEKAFAEASRLAPGDLTLAWIHAQALLGRDRFAEAKTALQACLRAGASPRRVQLYEADLFVRQGHYVDADKIYGELIDPQGPHDLAYFCARAFRAKDQTEGDDGIGRALNILRGFQATDRFLVYAFIRLSFHHSDRRQVRAAILKQFQEEGLFDCGTLAFYCFEQTQRLSRENVRGLFDVVITASSRLFKLSKAAWPRLGLCQLTLVTLPTKRWVLSWIRDRLEESLHVEPERPRLHLLRGVLSVLSGRANEELTRHWERARELGADPREFASWARALRKRVKGVDFSPYLPE
jgi:serine/threonine protein kinase/predicted Zn-dependent protease